MGKTERKDKDKSEMCSRCGKNEAQESHSCPYQREINDIDDEDYCDCCDDCQQNCLDDI